jgi:hypothetical protein
LLGSRLSILYRIEGDSEHPFSEAVGVLQKVDEVPSGVILEILKKGGAVTRIAKNDIVTLKVIPTRTI